MSKDGVPLNRRRFLKTAAQAGAVLAMPHVIPGTVLGKNGGVAPSERIVLGGIGIGNRGTYDLGCFLHEPDVRFVAVCDVKAELAARPPRKWWMPGTATRTAPRTSICASCWPAVTSTRC